MTEHYAATIGFFDGVHRGHQHLLQQVRETARQHALRSMVVTFAEHPRGVVCPDRRPLLLTTPEAKRALIEAQGIDRCVVLPFTAATARMTSEEFLRLLAQHYGVRVLLIGHDHHFGHDVGATVADYARYGAAVGIDIVRATAYAERGEMVSSSRIRRALAEGMMEDAVRWLGHPYALPGTVVEGCKIGRTMGFPTANIRPERGDLLVPARGVYAAWVVTHDGARHAAMVNIGRRPTFGDDWATTIEAHLLGFDGDLYGERLTLHFAKRLRDEKRFPDSAALRAQLEDDALRAETALLQNDFKL